MVQSLDDSYSQWRASARPTEPLELEEEAPVPVRRTYRPYSPRKPTRAALAEADEAYANIAVDETGDGLSLDQRLERLSERVVRRMELDLAYFSIPQLLTGLQRCLQVRVLLLTIQQKGGGSNVGSAVREYSKAFTPADDPRHGTADRRPAFSADDNILELITADADDDYDDGTGDAQSRGVARGRARSPVARRKGSSS